MMRVGVSTVINCSHKLPGTEAHGHTYRITAVVPGTEGYSDGLTFQSVKSMLLASVARLDHRPLEMGIGEPATAERLARHVKTNMQALIGRTVHVRVEVGEDGWVETD